MLFNGRWILHLALGLALGANAEASPDDMARRFPASTELFFSGKLLQDSSLTESLRLCLSSNEVYAGELDFIGWDDGFKEFAQTLAAELDGQGTVAWVRSGESRRPPGISDVPPSYRRARSSIKRDRPFPRAPVASKSASSRSHARCRHP